MDRPVEITRSYVTILLICAMRYQIVLTVRIEKEHG